MRIAITGSKGQLGLALQQVLARDDLLLIDLPEHDITDLSAMGRAISLFRPDVIVHAAAMTNVDGCEQDPEMAYRVNALGTRNIAVAAQECGARLAYVSTDYVFDGARSEPYWEFDDPNPLSIYGRSKWAGEQCVRSLSSRHYIARTAWLYGHGPRNFVETVLRLAQERGSLRMVTDEIGSPTFATDLAEALSKLVRLPAYGTYHLVNAGTCSRYEWAQEILSLAGARNVELVATENYQRLARVPKHSHLRNFCGVQLGIVLRPWREALADYMRQR